jgi:chitodextrinase
VATRPILYKHAPVLLIIVLLSAFSAAAQSAPQISCNDPIPTAPPADNLKFVVRVEPSTTWQPLGGEIKFTIEGVGVSIGNIVTCFRFRKKGPTPVDEQKPATPADEKKPALSEWVQSSLIRVVETNPNKITFAATVPSQIPGEEKSRWKRIFHIGGLEYYGAWSTVPMADFRVLSSGGTTTDNVLPIGITSVFDSVFLAGAFVVIAWLLLLGFAWRSGVPGKGVLKIISTPGGTASLSQFQIVLWTFVVGACAIYVMALSGSLIDITTGTLVLLGVSGIATLGAKLKDGQGAAPAAAGPAPTPTVPGTIQGIVTQASESAVRLSWQAPTSGGPPVTYTVQYRVAASPPNPWNTATMSITRPSFTVIGLTPGTLYDFQVSASNAGGSGPMTVANDTTASAAPIPPGAPGQVPSLGVTGLPTTSAVNLLWGQPAAAPAGYMIEYRIHDSDEFWQSTRSNTASSAFTVTGLWANTHYDFRVTAFNSAGSGPPSSIVSAMTGPRTPMWSDLIIPNDRIREIDVTRVQMLFFTLITAIFVGLKVLMSGEIPDIPSGFLLLMGISNGVYLTAKFIPD